VHSFGSIDKVMCDSNRLFFEFARVSNFSEF
jgi:hypothetical protein